MKPRFFASAVIAVLVLNVIGFAAGDTRSSRAKKRQVMRLVAVLPASDAIAVIESKRFLDEALPRVLSGNQTMLGEIIAKIDEMEERTGVDLGKFDRVAVGVAMKQVSANETDFQPVAIATGDAAAGAMAAVARLASAGTYREEKIAGRSVYVISPDVLQKTSAAITNSKLANILDKALKSLTRDIAVTTLDRNTLVMGPLARVRETLERRSHVAADISGLLPAKEAAVMSFAIKPPGGMSKWVSLDLDALGANIDSIEYLSGWLGVAVAGTSVQLLARTKKAGQAAALKDTLDVLQVWGGTLLGGSKRADQTVYARMIKSAKFDVRGTGVTLDLLVPQGDIDILISGVK